MVKLSDMGRIGFTVRDTQTYAHPVTFLPEPERRTRHNLLISVDDHVVEAPDAFEGRIPSHFGDRGPKVVTDDDGMHVWEVDGRRFPTVGMNAVAGRPVSEYGFDPVRFDHMRRGAWDIDARIADMDLNGIYASLNFPSALPGFAGQNFMRMTADQELGLACVRAWNDWIIDDWHARYPDRIIPCQIPWLYDPEVAAAEIYRNAERGFRAVSFSEAPEKLKLPSLHTGHWDPLIRACEDTGTVVCLHVGSSSQAPSTAPDAPPDTIGVLFFGYAMFAAVDWLYSLIPVRFPNLRIAMSEGGIAWVPGLIDRLDHITGYHEMYGTWVDIDMKPSEVFRRNFWFCVIDDTSCLSLRHHIGVNHIMMESDYPHVDTTWPDTQEVVRRQVDGFGPEETEKICWRNAADLFDWAVPDAVAADPEIF